MNETKDNNLIVECLEAENVPLFKLKELYDRYESSKNRIKLGLTNAIQSFMQIGEQLNNINENQLYLIEEFEDIYEFAETTFGFSKTLTSNYINVFLRFGNNPESIKGYSYSQIIELLPVASELDSFDEKMTVAEIRREKKNLQFLKKMEFAKSERLDYFKKLMVSIREKFNQLQINVDLSLLQSGNNRINLTGEFLDTQFEIDLYDSKEVADLRLEYKKDYPWFCKSIGLGPLISFFTLDSNDSDFIKKVIETKSLFDKKKAARLAKKENTKKIVEQLKAEQDPTGVIAPMKEDPLFNLKNDDDRNAFVEDEKNYELLGQFFGIAFYKFKYLEFGFYKYQNKQWQVKEYFELVDGVPNIGYNSGKYAIVAAIKEYKQSILS
jgi:hypothetical protein